jgi:subtilisin family serine protease
MLQRTGSLHRIVLIARRIRLLVSVALIFALAFPISSSLATQTDIHSADKIGPGVLDALHTSGQARVVVALAEPRSIKMSPFDLAAARQDIAALQSSVLALVGATDFHVKHRYQAVPALAGVLRSEGAARALTAHPGVVRIDLDAGGSGALGASVPLIGANKMHARGIAGNGIVVAVLDSGVDTDHSDFAGAIIHQECFLDNGGSIDGNGRCPNGSDRQSGAGAAEDDAGHGTHVTGIIMSHGVRSSVGVAPGAKIVAIKVTAGPSFSGVFFSFSEVIAGLDFIINQRPDVQIINMSLVTNATFAGDCDNSTSWNMAGAAAINTLRARGVVTFASSGNTGSGTAMASPACLHNVISVGATDNSDNVASFTSSNASTDLVAPGVGIISSGLADGTANASGTSMASPHAAGCAALFMQLGIVTTPDQIEARLKSSAVQVTNPTNGRTYPRIDCNPPPLSAVALEGPTYGLVDTPYTFTSTSSPISALTPLTYTWSFDGHVPITTTGNLSSSLSLSWPIAGTYGITVTASNTEAIVTDTHTIVISPSLSIYLPLEMR